MSGDVWWEKDGREVAYDQIRFWKGEDANYLILTVAGLNLPYDITISDRVRVEGRDTVRIYVVRSVECDMRTETYTVSCIDEEKWNNVVRLRPLPTPPAFRTQEEADAWLEQARD